jgi:hypothetical protein
MLRSKEENKMIQK